TNELTYVNQLFNKSCPGILLEDFNDNLLPVLFPKQIIENLKKRPEVKQLFLAEALHVAIPIIDYVFQPSSDNKEYFLSIQFSYLFTADNIANKKPFINFRIARFDYVIVHAMAEVIVNNGDYTFNLN